MQVGGCYIHMKWFWEPHPTPQALLWVSFSPNIWTISSLAYLCGFPTAFKAAWLRHLTKWMQEVCRREWTPNRLSCECLYLRVEHSVLCICIRECQVCIFLTATSLIPSLVGQMVKLKDWKVSTLTNLHLGVRCSPAQRDQWQRSSTHCSDNF